MRMANGKVLGITFDAEKFCWSLLQDKKEKNSKGVKETLRLVAGIS